MPLTILSFDKTAFILYLGCFLSLNNLFSQNIHFSRMQGVILTIDSIFVSNQYIPGKLIFDTGAGKSILDKKFRRYLSEIESGKKNNTYYGKLKEKNAVLDSFQVGDLKIKTQPVSLLDIKKIVGDCNPNHIVGIIGLDIIRQYHWKIDFKKGKLYFNNNKTFDTFDYEPYKVKMKYAGKKLFSTNKNNRLPSIQMNMDGSTKEFLFDTGSSIGISIHKRERRIRKNKALSKERYNVIGHKASVEKRGKSIMHVGNDEIDVSPIYSSHLETSVGVEFLKHLDIIINRGLEKIYFKKRNVKALKETKIKYGFSLAIIDQKLTVVSLYKNSPAYKSGLRIFDKIIRLNEKDYTQPKQLNCDSLNTLAKEFKKPKMRLKLSSGKEIVLKTY